MPSSYLPVVVVDQASEDLAPYVVPFESGLTPWNESKFSMGVGVDPHRWKGAVSMGRKRHTPEQIIQRPRRAVAPYNPVVRHGLPSQPDALPSAPTQRPQPSHRQGKTS